MSDCCPWLSRPSCCRRQPQHAYIFLYSPNMAGPSSSSSFHCCFVCILFGLCLAFVVILAAAVIYHLNGNILIRTTTIDPRTWHEKKISKDLIMKKNSNKNGHIYDINTMTKLWQILLLNQSRTKVWTECFFFLWFSSVKTFEMEK